MGGSAPAVGWWQRLARVLRLRYVILGVVAAACGVVSGGRGDWNDFVDAGRAMMGRTGFDVFVTHRDIQTGPVSLFVARLFAFTPRNGFVLCSVACLGLGLLSLRCLELTARDGRRDDVRTSAAVLLGGLPLVFTWAKLGGYGHLDDALVLAAGSYALLRARAGESHLAAVPLGVALAVKPWSIVFVPLALDTDSRSVIARLGPVVRALLAGALLWALFFVFAPDTLDSLRPTVNVAPDSVLHLFGVTSDSLPDWLRTAQLGGALVITAWAGWRRRFDVVLLGGVAVRLATDPGTWSYYTPGFVLAVLAWELCSSRRVVPVATFAAAVLLAPTWLVPSDPARGVLRLVACVLALGVTIRRLVPAPVSEPAPSATPSSPTPGPAARG